MGVFDFLKRKKEPESAVEEKKEPISHLPSGGYSNTLFNIYDGEKNTGELGLPVHYHLDYTSLRNRSWSSYLDNEITQTIIKKYVLWIIGGGLKLQSEPISDFIKSSGESAFDQSTFSMNVETRFSIYCNSKKPDYQGLKTLNQIAKTVYLSSIIGGDCLVIQRVDKSGNLSIQLIDGANVMSPFINPALEGPGNKIINGIETNKKGEHVAYWVKQKDLTFKRIKAKGTKSGQQMAFMVYGLRYRIHDNRGIPLISTVLETISKIDRYKEAAVSSAEERAKIVYQIIHKEFSTGENPLQGTMAKAFDRGAEEKIPRDVQGQILANEVAVTTNKQTFNLPIGSELKAVDSLSELYFEGFYSTNVHAICSTIGIPPEVALSKYDSNFSASRAALKDWEHTINIERKRFSEEFYKNIYNFWLNLQIVNLKIQAPGYLNSFMSGDWEMVEAYQNCRFVGANVPHIDPMKEVQAERAKLGESGKNIPLTTAEAATEALNGGDFKSNLAQYTQELDSTNELNIQSDVKETGTGEADPGGDE